VEYSQDHIVHQNEPVGEQIVKYGDNPDQVIELSGQSNQGPLLVLIHGGYWRPTIDRSHLRPLAKALNDRGFQVALVEYRRVQGRPTDYLDDVIDALKKLGEVSIILIGHSAGAHLALLAGRLARNISLILALSPVADLKSGIGHNLGDGAIQLFLGDKLEKIDDFDPTALTAAQTRIRIIHTEQDFIPEEVAKNYFQRKRDEGADIEYTLVAGADHFSLVDPRSEKFEFLLEAIADQ
jgi:acetyl esterase/lipase